VKQFTAANLRQLALSAIGPGYKRKRPALRGGMVMQIDESVGVLLVHGIGEQRRFQHLETEVRSLASALEQTYGREGGRITVQITPGASSAFQAEKESWRCDRRPPVQILLRKPMAPQPRSAFTRYGGRISTSPAR
jgi:hypothetical protein